MHNVFSVNEFDVLYIYMYILKNELLNETYETTMKICNVFLESLLHLEEKEKKNGHYKRTKDRDM